MLATDGHRESGVSNTSKVIFPNSRVLRQARHSKIYQISMEDRRPSHNRSAIVEEIESDIMGSAGCRKVNKGIFSVLRERIMIPIAEERQEYKMDSTNDVLRIYKSINAHEAVRNNQPFQKKDNYILSKPELMRLIKQRRDEYFEEVLYPKLD